MTNRQQAHSAVAAENVAATFRSPATGPGRNSWRRKNNRLSREAYVGSNAYFVSSATAGRSRRFIEPGFTGTCVQVLREAAVAERFEILAYVFMPDHVHLLLLGSEEAELGMFMKRFKQMTAFHFKRRTGEILWQKSYHDRIMRRDEDLSDAARYIAANPVRAELVTSWESYPFTGGTLLEGARTGDLKVAATDSWAPV